MGIINNFFKMGAGLSMGTPPTYSDNLPCCLRSSAERFNAQTCKEIEINMKFEEELPLTIANSIIPGANLGMFATRDLPKERIVLVYRGMYRPHYEVKTNNDSVFTLGLIDTDMPTLLLIDPSEDGNAARFINSAYKKHLNCTAKTGIYVPTNGNLPYPVVLIVTTKNIQRGE